MTFDPYPRVTHGGTGKYQRERSKRSILDFSASINPYPPHFEWHVGPIDCYPDDHYTHLKEVIAHSYGRSPEEICVGNGSIEILRVFCLVALRERSFFVEDPTFGEYEYSARQVGAVREPTLSSADVAFVCNPNNPTGRLREKQELLRLLEQIKEGSGLLFCDEAFIDLSDPAESLSSLADPSLFVLHSLTKSFAVPGMRFGFGLGDAELIDAIEARRPPWSVNAYAESFAIEALSHRDELRVSRERIKREREWLSLHLEHSGLTPYPSETNYVLVETGRSVGPLCQRLLEKGILVRDCTSFGLPTCIRISLRTREENTHFVEALESCVL